MNYLEQLKWVFNPGSTNHPSYSEADISEVFADLIDQENQSLEVNIRKYPRLYTIAFEFHDLEEEDLDGWEYTQDGEGDGVIPIGPYETIVIARLPHHELEFHWDAITKKLREKIANYIKG